MRLVNSVFVIAILFGSLSAQPNEFFEKLLPTKADAGFQMDGYWIWCGSVIKGGDRDRFVTAAKTYIDGKGAHADLAAEWVRVVTTS